jgi:hypothetical protein
MIALFDDPARCDASSDGFVREGLHAVRATFMAGSPLPQQTMVAQACAETVGTWPEMQSSAHRHRCGSVTPAKSGSHNSGCILVPEASPKG